MLKNNRGFFHLHLLSISFFVLALVGAWHIYNSYKQNRLTTEMQAMIRDYTYLTKQAIACSPDREKIEQDLQALSQALNKTKPGIINQLTSQGTNSLAYPYQTHQ